MSFYIFHLHFYLLNAVKYTVNFAFLKTIKQWAVMGTLFPTIRVCGPLSHNHLLPKPEFWFSLCYPKFMFGSGSGTRILVQL